MMIFMGGLAVLNMFNLRPGRQLVKEFFEHVQRGTRNVKCLMLNVEWGSPVIQHSTLNI
jgi:hypothetical protein